MNHSIQTSVLDACLRDLIPGKRGKKKEEAKKPRMRHGLVLLCLMSSWKTCWPSPALLAVPKDGAPQALQDKVSLKKFLGLRGGGSLLQQLKAPELKAPELKAPDTSSLRPQEAAYTSSSRPEEAASISTISTKRECPSTKREEDATCTSTLRRMSPQEEECERIYAWQSIRGLPTPATLEEAETGSSCASKRLQVEAAGQTRCVEVEEECVRVTRHKNAVAVLLVAHIGGQELLISADGSGLIIVWETDNFTQLSHLKGHKRGVASLALAGSKMYSGGYDNDIREWSLESMRGCLAAAGVPEVSLDPNPQTNPNAFVTWPGHAAPVLALAVTPGALLSGDMHGVVKKWKCCDASPKPRQEGRGGGGGVDVVTGVWDEADVTFQAHFGQVWALAVDETRNLVFSAGEDWEIASWVLPACRPARKLQTHSGPVRSLLVVGDVLLSGGCDCVVVAHSLASGHALPFKLKHTGWIMSMKVTPDLSTLVTACSDGGIYFWHLLTGRLVQEDEFVHKDWVTSVVLLGATASQDGCKGGGRVASASFDMDLIVRPFPSLC